MRIHSLSIGQIFSIIAVAAMMFIYIMIRGAIVQVDTQEVRNMFTEGIRCVEAVKTTEEIAMDLVMQLVTEKCGAFAEMNAQSIKLYMKEMYANKDNCRDLAQDLLDEGLIEDMTVNELSAEIYTHAFFYYLFEAMPEAVHALPGLSSVYNSVSNGIDLASGGDTPVRQVAYAIIYRVF